MRKATFDHYYGKADSPEFTLTEKDIDNFIKNQEDINNIPIFSEHDNTKSIGRLMQIRKDPTSSSNLKIDVEINSLDPQGSEILDNMEKSKNNTKMKNQ
jgi:hypothetical protein